MGKVFSPKELAGQFDRITPRTLAEWRQSGKGPRFFREGKFVFYREEDVEAWKAERVERTAQSA